MRPAILRRRSLAYPGGAKPGFDPTHPMATGVLLSAISLPNGTFVNLVPGFASLSSTASGTIGKTIDGALGPARTAGTSYIASFTSGGFSNGTPCTIAAIIRIKSTNDGGILQAGTTGVALGCFGNKITFAASSGFVNTGAPALTNGHVYFAVFSFQGTTNNPLQFLVCDLSNGKIATQSTIFGNNTAFTGSGFQIGTEALFSNFFDGNVAAVYYSANYNSLTGLTAWAADPWSFWYPPYPIGDIPVLSSVGTSSGTLALSARSTAQSKGTISPTAQAALVGQATARAMAKAQSAGALTASAKSTAQAKSQAQSAGQTAMSAKSTAQAKSKAAPTAVVLLAGRSFAMSTGRGANNSGSTIALTATSTAMSKALASATGAVLFSARSTAQAKSLAAAAGITLLTAKSTAQSKTSAGAAITTFLSGRSTAQAKALASAKAVVALTGTSAAQAKALAAGTGAVLLTGQSAAQAKAMAQIGTGSFIALAARSSAMSSAFGVPTLTFTPPPAGSQLIFAGDPREQDRLRKKKVKLREELEAEEERLERAREAHQKGIADIVQRKGAKPPPPEALPEPEPEPIKIEPALAKVLKEHSARAQQYDEDEEESAVLLLLL